NKFTFVFLLAVLFCFIANVNANDDNNDINKKECECLNNSDDEGVMEAIFGVNKEKRMIHEKKSLVDETAVNVNANGSDNDGSDSGADSDGCYTNFNGATTTVFVTSTTSTRTITATSEKVVSDLPTVTATLTSTITSYRPTNDITNDSTHASNIKLLSFLIF
ncbi:hypothetical protein LY90DRAFT_632147, partial [Neocallimastix californiae]